MKNATIEIEVKAHTKSVEKKLKKVTKLAEQLEAAMEGLKSIEIGVEVIRVENKWWQFWK